MEEVLLTLWEAAMPLGALVAVVAAIFAAVVFWPYVRRARRRVLGVVCDAIGGGWSIGRPE